MLLRPAACEPIEIATDAAVHIVRDGGIRALSVRAIATRMGVTAPALLQRYDNRARLFRLVVAHVGDRWLWWAGSQWQLDGIAGLLPQEAEAIAHAHVWLAFQDLARNDLELGPFIAKVRDGERSMVERTLRRDPGWLSASHEASTDLAVAAVEGLRVSMCSPTEPLPAVRARAALTHLLSHGCSTAVATSGERSAR